MLRSSEPAILKPAEHIVNAQPSACGAYFSDMSEPKGSIISLLKSSAVRFVSQRIATLNKKTKKSEIFCEWGAWL